MIAIGISLFFLGVGIANLWGDPRPLRHNKADYLAGFCIIIGACSGVAGLTILAWRHLP